ncbi:MAG: type I restriction endonuclease subunit R, partial [Kiritimatiellales bacterium]
MFSEKYESQIPALQLLAASGWTILTVPQADQLRGGKRNHVLLEAELARKLQEINSINHKGGVYKFSEANIQDAIQKLKNLSYDGLLRTNEKIYDLLTLGCALEQNIDGDLRSFNLSYINWRYPEANSFIAVAELPIERRGSYDTVRPDILLFVNGIPFVSIECKAPEEDIEQAISQTLRNQQEDYIAKLFTFVQMTLAVNRRQAFYGTVGTPRKFWAVWREKQDRPAELDLKVNQPLSAAQNEAIFSGPFEVARTHFAEQLKHPRIVTEQDQAIYSLCRPARLLELAWRFVVFDGADKKIARYQQYFVVKSALERIKMFTPEGKRKGGVIWHTQGSGKSLTMVMLVRSLALVSDIVNPKIVLVTDRTDLDEQLGNTFRACSIEAERATSGKHLLELAHSSKAAIITTLIQKFNKAMKARSEKIESSNIFLLVDEGHRTHYGPLAGRMRQMFPNACYIAFTGTPLNKKDKDSFQTFGDLISPVYSIRTAVADKAVVPLLYEGRYVEMEQNQPAIDLWFERHTQGLSEEQRADLKKKYSRADTLNKAKQVVYMRAFDISEHYRDRWQGTGFKAQLVAPDKDTAVLFHKFLNEIGMVSSEVIISAPDTREGNDSTSGPTPEVTEFWKQTMARFGNKEDEYNKQIINAFKTASGPEILIVVDKLLTGFDVPRNTVLYLCRSFSEPVPLLQAIARVNRLCEHKEFGYIIDYAGVLDKLDKAMIKYGKLEGVADEDIIHQLDSLQEVIAKLPQAYAAL